MKNISVIIPVYNAEKYIDRCVQSLILQTLENIEFIFVNDCSTDTSLKILTKYQEEYPETIKVLSIITLFRLFFCIVKALDWWMNLYIIII